MTPIQLQITITPSAETAAAFVELLRKVQKAASGIDEQHEARIRASRHAQLGGKELPKDMGLLITQKEVATLLGGTAGGSTTITRSVRTWGTWKLPPSQR